MNFEIFNFLIRKIVYFALSLSPQLEDAVNKGVPLYFLVEFELLRPRWYWWDERTALATLA